MISLEIGQITVPSSSFTGLHFSQSVTTAELEAIEVKAVQNINISAPMCMKLLNNV